MFKDKVLQLLNEAFAERKDLFLIDLAISEHNNIKIIIDGDEPVSVQDCVFVSRAIEHNLDREAEDFSLEVTTCGITSPLQNIRQYRKNIGRTLQVQLDGGEKLEGVLNKVESDTIAVSFKKRVPKTTGKGKQTVEMEQSIPLNTIQKATIKIAF